MSQLTKFRCSDFNYLLAKRKKYLFGEGDIEVFSGWGEVQSPESRVQG